MKKIDHSKKSKNALSGTNKIAVIAFCDFIAIIVSTLISPLFAKGYANYADIQFWFWLVINIAETYLFFVVFRLYSIVFKSAGIIEMLKIVCAALCILVMNMTYMYVFDVTLGVRMCVSYSFLVAIIASFVRFHKRFYYAIRYVISMIFKTGRIRVMIVGGGNAGTTIIRELQNPEKVKYAPVCIIDDDVLKKGKSIGNVRIVGDTYSIPYYAERLDIEEIFIAMPSAPKTDINRIYDICKRTDCKIKILPGIYQIMSGEATVSALRPVRITDLLGREQIKVNLDEIMDYIENEVVMVTGGGGSIGSELCRQIATHKPRQLIILDIYENNAYDIEQELKRKYPELNLLALIASVRDITKMRDVFAKYRPQIIFHAAAHKHVPLMETSPNEAVKNNVFGTLNVARCADEFGAKTFVQISTDKAVNPTNVMGATKRICEMIIQTIGKHSLNTKFVAVRFGNVLGSNGSVIPLFEKQIAEGGPVTVTHKDIIRYFMTIPEAVSLVLQAGAYAKGGQIFVLDMGEPVKIYDLACNLIKLSGLEPNVDIEIKCTGLRPGEKLYEERLMDEEGMQKTPNGLINIANPIEFDEKAFWEELKELRDEAEAETSDIRRMISVIVPTCKFKNN